MIFGIFAYLSLVFLLISCFSAMSSTFSTASVVGAASTLCVCLMSLVVAEEGEKSGCGLARVIGYSSS
ncbi:hypothetical protein BC567DRAFT_226531 [Phyllosticta citribraziliensis]